MDRTREAAPAAAPGGRGHWEIRDGARVYVAADRDDELGAVKERKTRAAVDAAKAAPATETTGKGE